MYLPGNCWMFFQGGYAIYLFAVYMHVRMHVCMGVGMYVFRCMCTHALVREEWRPEINVLYFARLLSNLFTEVGFLVEPRTHQFCWSVEPACPRMFHPHLSGCGITGWPPYVPACVYVGARELCPPPHCLHDGKCITPEPSP